MRYIKLPIAVLAFVVSAALTLSAQEAKHETSSAPTPTEPAGAPAVKHESHDLAWPAQNRLTATVGSDGVQHVEIVGGEYYFNPNYIIVKQNIPVELSVKKTPGYVPHDIVVKAPEAGMDFKIDLKKQTQLIKFTPTKPGKYEMYCDEKLLFFKSHKDRGMDGMIEVVP